MTQKQQSFRCVMVGWDTDNYHHFLVRWQKGVKWRMVRSICKDIAKIINDGHNVPWRDLQFHVSSDASPEAERETWNTIRRQRSLNTVVIRKDGGFSLRRKR